MRSLSSETRRNCTLDSPLNAWLSGSARYICRRRIKRYLAFLEQGVAIPTGEQQNDSSLADWIRHAKVSGMYEAGKMLFERGGLSLDRLSEEAAVNVEEDYQVCVRSLSRQGKG